MMKKMNRTTKSLIFLLFLSTSTLFTSGVSSLVGGWKPIKDPANDRETQTVAKFAVAEHNKEATSSGDKKEQVLVFLKVVSGETQVVAGTNYRLIIKAKDGNGTGAGAVHSYETVVFVKPWEKVMKVTSFKLVA